MARKRRKKGQAVQQQLEFRDKDGRRHRSGRPRSKASGIPHTRRSEFSAEHPLHVTLKICEGLPSQRKRRAFKAVMRSFAEGKSDAKGTGGFRLTQFAVLGNHMHLMVEADSREHLASAMGGLKTRLARALNKVWERSGTVFKERYHDVALNNPSRVKNALNYILHNGRKHGIVGLERWFDPCSSARWFDGFGDAIADTKWPDSLVQAKTWLLVNGWRRRGLLTLVPAPPAL
jgi:REP element-mobilizing transposase RayT